MPCPRQSCYALLKYQVLARYLDTPRLHGVIRELGYSSVWIALLPCALAACAGLSPQILAMVLSRARAERRDAMQAASHNSSHAPPRMLSASNSQHTDSHFRLTLPSYSPTIGMHVPRIAR